MHRPIACNDERTIKMVSGVALSLSWCGLAAAILGPERLVPSNDEATPVEKGCHARSAQRTGSVDCDDPRCR